MAWWNILFGGAADLVKAGTGVVTAIAGDQAAKDQQLSSEQVALLNQYAAEFVARQQRSFWDSFVDGVNRLVRPGLALGAQAAFVWAALDPVGFAEVMRVLAIVPDPLWVIWGGIWAFYFTGRIAEQLPKKWKVEPRAAEIAKEVAAERAARRQAREAARQAEPAATPPAALPAPEPRPVQESQSLTGLIADDHVYAGPIDNATDPLRAMAATVWGEARGEPFEGKVAVAWVIINRSRKPGWWGEDIRSVCSARWQFSCW